ncbi:MAG: chlorhexidine efflux PACE transporter AceI [Acinetobacter sp.]
MIISKKRLIHAIIYEGILLLIVTFGLSRLFHLPTEMTGILALLMALVAMVWNMVFNHFFEKMENALNWQRTLNVRIIHALGFEGGLLLFSVPIIAYIMKLGIWDAFLLDIALTLCILVYTFIFQWCFDYIELKFFSSKMSEHEVIKSES